MKVFKALILLILLASCVRPDEQGKVVLIMGQQRTAITGREYWEMLQPEWWECYRNGDFDRLDKLNVLLLEASEHQDSVFGYRYRENGKEIVVINGKEL